MCKRWTECWEMLSEDAEMSKREVTLGLLLCLLLGIVIGILFSPKKYVSIASNNGSNNCGCGCDDEEELDEE